MTDSDSETPSALIARAVLRLGRRLRGVRPAASVNLSTLSLLTALNRSGPMAGAQLAREERLQPQSLTRLLAAMEAEGLIVRQTDPGDRRALVIHITREGRAVVARDVAARRAWLDQAMDMALSPQEREQLVLAAPLMLRVAGEDPESRRAFRRTEGPAAGQGGGAVIPGVYYDNARAGVEWLKSALGFETAEAYEGAGGKIAFARMVFCGSAVFVSSRSRGTAWSAVGASAIFLVSPDAEDVKARYAMATAAGAEIVRALHLAVSPAFPQGVQQFDLRDPEGHLWTVGAYRPGAPAGKAQPSP